MGKYWYMRATWSEAGSRANWVDGVAIDVDGQAAAQVGKGEVAGRLPAPVAEKWQKIPERGVDYEDQVTTCRCSWNKWPSRRYYREALFYHVIF